MKVLVISHMYPSPANDVYGIFVHKQIIALMNNGIEVRVLSPRPLVLFPFTYIFKKYHELNKIPKDHTIIYDKVFVEYPRFLQLPHAFFLDKSGYLMYQGIKKQVKQLYKEFPFDLIHAHVALPDGYAGALIAQDFGKPLILSIHGVDLQKTIHRGPKYLSSLCFPFNHASKVIVVSEKLKLISHQNPWRNDHVIVIPNGINFDDLPREVGHHNAEKVILSVSNLVHTKGIDLNLYAIKTLLKKHPTLTYNIIGDGAEKQNLLELVKRLDIQKEVNFLGRKPNNEVLKNMADCTIFCLPSWNEAFGIVYLEAMALGKPVIGCRGEGIEDFVEHNVNGILVKPKNVESIVEALDFLLSSPKKSESIGENARNHIVKNYTWEKNAEKTINAYYEVLQ